MMTRTSLSLILTTLGVFLIAAPIAAAYATPEQILEATGYGENQYESVFNPGYNEYNARRIQRLHAEQEAQRIARFSRSSAPVEDETFDGAASSIAMSESSDGTVTVSLDAETLRLLKRLGDNNQTASVTEPTHGGVPLAPTGLTSTLAGIALLMAGTVTLWRARRTE